VPMPFYKRIEVAQPFSAEECRAALRG
jgi:hypothetical protein